MRCTACHADNAAGLRFCEACGAKLEAVCPACGAVRPADRKFCGECGASLAAVAAEARFASPQSYTPPHLAARILQDRAALTGERKQVTVLFADVSGFTSISERLDPEDVHGLMSGAFDLMLAAVHRFEGTVNQFLGDGLMALFGAPVAHEDHAVRAARAALAMQEALGRYRDELRRDRGIEFRVRMGLSTGLVVVGAIGDNLRMDYTAVGDTSNTAARMQQLAEPGQIVVAQSTQQLIAPYCELRALGSVTVKNKAQPVAAWALLRAKSGVTRLEARATRGLSPFVGRDDALAIMERAFAAARAGEGQVALVVGEAGIGKSRLLREFRRAADGARWIEGECVSFAHATPFLIVIALLKRLFEITDGDADADIGTKVDAGIAMMGDHAAAAAPYLKFLLGVDPGDPAVATLDPLQRRGRIVDALLRLFGAAGARQPLVLVVEDAHWIDPASEDFLRSLAENVVGMPALLVVTYRPTYQQLFGDRTNSWRINLRPLDEPASMRVVRAALGGDELADDVARAIARRGEGNPFFLEEIGRALAETDALRGGGGRGVAAPDAVAVPATVQDVVAARIDRLEERQKRTVQTASVIGREFALALLRRVSDAQQELERSLADLKRIELVYEKAGLREEYVFRHALTQDVAYASVLHAERRRLHASIGHAIEELYAGRLDERAEELVHHFRRGEVWEGVVRYAREAAERAAALCVDDKAVELYDVALDALGRLPETPERARMGVDVRLAMRAPLWRAGFPDRVFELFKDAESLATRHGFTDVLDTVYAFLVQYHWAKGDQDDSLEYGRRCLERAEARGDVALRLTALFYRAHSQESLGLYAEAQATAVAIADWLEGPRAKERYGLSGLPYSGACALGAACAVQIGDDAGALALLERGQRVADAANHLYSQMVMAVFRAHVLAELGRVDEALAMFASAIAVCREKKFVGQLINGLRYSAMAYVAAERPREAITAVNEASALQEAARVYVTRSWQLATRAEAELQLGDLDAAEATLAAALAFALDKRERCHEARVYYLQAELVRRRGDRAAARALLVPAARIAEELSMVRLRARCGAALGEAA